MNRWAEPILMPFQRSTAQPPSAAAILAWLLFPPTIAIPLIWPLTGAMMRAFADRPPTTRADGWPLTGPISLLAGVTTLLVIAFPFAFPTTAGAIQITRRRYRAGLSSGWVWLAWSCTTPPVLVLLVGLTLLQTLVFLLMWSGAAGLGMSPS